MQDEEEFLSPDEKHIGRLAAEVERLRAIIEDCARLCESKDMTETAAALRRGESPYPPVGPAPEWEKSNE